VSQVLARKLEKVVPLLGAPHDGEVVSAARALDRVLRDAGLDFHDLARTITAPPVAPVVPENVQVTIMMPLYFPSNPALIRNDVCILNMIAGLPEGHQHQELLRDALGSCLLRQLIVQVRRRLDPKGGQGSTCYSWCGGVRLCALQGG
jgi:hypothetical protein